MDYKNHQKKTSYKALCCIFLAGVMILFSLFSVAATVTTTLNSPANGLNNTFNAINFNCSALTDSGYLTNISLFTNSTGSWVRNLTNLIWTNSSTGSFNSSGSNGTFIDSGWTNPTYPFDYNDATAATLVGGAGGDIAGTIGLMLGEYQFVNDVSFKILSHNSFNNAGINHGTYQLKLLNSSGWSNYAGSVVVPYSTDGSTGIFTVEINQSVMGIELYVFTDCGSSAIPDQGVYYIQYSVNNQTTQIFPFNLSNYTVWNCLACNNNSVCSYAAANRTVNYNMVENSRTVPTSASQGSTQTFTINLTAIDAVTSAYLNYNGTRYSTSITAGTYTVITTSMIIPSVTADTSATILWELFTGYGGVNSTSSTMAVSTSTIDNCTNNHLQIYNFTIKDELSKAILGNITGKVNVQIYSFDRATLITSYSTTTSDNYLGLCVNSTFGATENFSIDAEIEYTSTNYNTEYYHIQNETLNNNYLYQNISLYNLNTTLAKVFKIIYKDSSYRAIGDAIIKIYRKYPGDTDLWKITEIPITDYNGETTASLEENDVVYSFYVYKYGALLSSFENVFVKCQYSSIDQCTLNLNAFSSGITIDDLEDEADFNFTIGYNATSRIISSTFNIPSGTSHLITLVVTTDDVLETSVCTDSLTSSSGTVSCTVPNTFGNSTIKAKLYKDGLFQSYGNIKLDQNPVDIYGGGLVVLGLLVLLSLVGASISGNPVVMIMSFLIGIIALISLNLVSNNGFIGATASVLFLVVAIIIILIKIGRRN